MQFLGLRSLVMSLALYYNIHTCLYIVLVFMHASYPHAHSYGGGLPLGMSLTVALYAGLHELLMTFTLCSHTSEHHGCTTEVHSMKSYWDVVK